MFVTVNMPGGSNNDLSPWTAPFNTAADQVAQAAEKDQRTAADIRWLNAAFDAARANNDKAVVVVLQADLWDPQALPAAGGQGVDQYASFVQALAARQGAAAMHLRPAPRTARRRPRFARRLRSRQPVTRTETRRRLGRYRFLDSAAFAGLCHPRRLDQDLLVARRDAPEPALDQGQ